MTSNTAVPKASTRRLGVDRADALDHAGAEVAFDAAQGVRRRDLDEHRPELPAVLAVGDPVARGGGVLAGGDGRRVADERDQIALALDLQPQNTKAAVGVVKRHPLDEPIEKLQTGPCRSFGQCHGCMRKSLERSCAICRVKVRNGPHSTGKAEGVIYSIGRRSRCRPRTGLRVPHQGSGRTSQVDLRRCNGSNSTTT